MRRVLVFVILFLLFFSVTIQARIFFVGSNPYLSVMAFPQDILKYQGNFAYYYPTYQKLPWWGDIDDQSNIPPFGDYSTTEENYSREWIDSETGEVQKRSYYHKSSHRTFKNEIGFSHKFNDSLVNTTSITYSNILMKDEMDGLITNAFDPSRGAFPVEYNLKHLAHHFYIQSMFGFNLQHNPFGIKVGFGMDEGGDIERNYSIRMHKGEKKDSADDSLIINSRKMMWGWSQEECSLIFGFKSEADGHSQYEYALGPMYRGDLQFGWTLPRVKLGTRFRYTRGDQDQYTWRVDSTSLVEADDMLDSSFAESFCGDYYEHGLNRETNAALYRLYGNIFWKKGKRYSLNTLLFLGLESVNRKNILGIHNLFDYRKYDISDEKTRTLIGEINPNINLYPGKKFSYIDVALLLEGCRTLSEISNRPEVADPSDNDYNVSSEVEENFADIGIDISTLFPIFGGKRGYVALGMIAFANSKFSWYTEKYRYATTPDPDVSIYHLEKDRVEMREFWFNSMFILQWGIGNFQIRAELIEPLLYSLKKTEKRTYYKRDQVASSHTTRENSKFNLWASQDQVKAGLFFAYNVNNFFRNRNRQ